MRIPLKTDAPAPDRLNRWRYGLYAPVYDVIAGVFTGQRKLAIAALRLHAGQRVLMVGCGTGLDLDFIPAGVAVTGLDLTPGMVARAEERARRREQRRRWRARARGQLAGCGQGAQRPPQPEP